MANTIFTYTGNGVANSWTVGCDYLSKEHIELWVNDVEDVTFSWITDSTIAATSVPANGAAIIVKRVTPRSALVTSIPVSGTLRGNDVNRIGLQALYVAEEGYDALTSVLQEDLTDGKWDAESKVIKDLGTPVAATDAVTKEYVDDVIQLYDDAATSAAAALASQIAAAASATAASGSATTASTQAGIATAQAVLADADRVAAAASASAASSSASTASTHATTATTQAGNASTSASAASSSAAAASASASAASGSASTASTQATNASNSASSASASASTATTQATNAGNSATAASSSASSASSSASTATTQANNASSSASTASGHATTATTQAGIATTQAGNASTSASTATTQAGLAATAKTNAETAETNAEAAQAAAEAALDAFTDIYLGSKTSDPTLDNDGNALSVGALYWNSVASNLRVYNGSAWSIYSATAYSHPNHSGDVTSVGDGATTIAADAVTNTKLANMAQNTIKGRVTASTGDPEDLTAAQVRTIINVEDGATADMSASELLTAIKTVDGAGSGLDADLLDGISSASFLQTSAIGSTVQAYDADLADLANSALLPTSTMFKRATGAEGGECRFEVPASGTTLAGSVTMDIYADNLRIFEGGGSARGVYIPLTDGVGGAGTPVIFPSGTRLTFQQTSAPTGWTKDTTHDNKAMRLVSGSVGSGGSVSFTSAFTSRGLSGSVSGTVGNTTLTESQLAAHSHNRRRENGASSSVTGIFATAFSVSNTLQATDSAGGGSSHNHSWSGSISVNNLDMAVQYVDFIVASRN